VIWILGGIWALITALVVLLGKGELAQEYIVRRPGILILSIGMAILGKGIANMFGPSGVGSSKWIMLRSLPRQIGGFLLVILSLAVIGLGLFEIIAPLRYDVLFASILNLFSTGFQ
jgi:hypothetical protein